MKEKEDEEEEWRMKANDRVKRGFVLWMQGLERGNLGRKIGKREEKKTWKEGEKKERRKIEEVLKT